MLVYLLLNMDDGEKNTAKLYKQKMSCFCIPSYEEASEQDYPKNYVDKDSENFKNNYMKKEEIKVENAVDKDNFIKKGEAKFDDLSEDEKQKLVEDVALKSKENMAIDGVAYDKWCGFLQEKDVKREIVKKIINKQDVYDFYNTKLKEIQKMPGDIDIICDRVNKQWLQSKDLTQKKIEELNKNIECKKCHTDLAYCEDKQVPTLLNGKRYNLKDAVDGKYKKVLVINS